MMINGRAHGPEKGTATCQLHMRSFKDGDTLYLEPWRAKAFPIIKDLIVNRSAFDRIIQSGGFISVSTGGAPEANSLPVSKEDAELSMDAAECIGCGACVAACPNASAMLYTAAKVSHLGLLPQGQPERYRRTLRMVAHSDLKVLDPIWSGAYLVRGLGHCVACHSGPKKKGDRQQQDLEEDLVASDQPILQYPPASLGTLVNPSTLNTYLSCLDRRESPDHKCNRAVLLSGCRQTVVKSRQVALDRPECAGLGGSLSRSGSIPRVCQGRSTMRGSSRLRRRH
jgi:ferredoxin